MTVQLEKSCPTSITTKSGTFSFHTEEVPSCKAKKICASLGRILAPITNAEDRNAIHGITSQKCGIFKGRLFDTYHVGLDNIVCDNETHRVFTNGVEYNETLHGEFYYIYPRNKKKSNCLASLYATGDPADKSKVFVISMPDTCEDYRKRFICLEQAKYNDSNLVPHELKKSKRSELTASGAGLKNQQNLFFLSGLFFVCLLAIGCCVLMVAVSKLKVKNKSLNERNLILETENKSLKSLQAR